MVEKSEENRTCTIPGGCPERGESERRAGFKLRRKSRRSVLYRQRGEKVDVGGGPPEKQAFADAIKGLGRKRKLRGQNEELKVKEKKVETTCAYLDEYRG